MIHSVPTPAMTPAMSARLAAARRQRKEARAAQKADKPMRGRRIALLAAALALPAMAAEREWNAARDVPAEIAPMPFETAGENFPGSAFYYLEDEGYVAPSDADFTQVASTANAEGVLVETETSEIPGVGAVAAPLVALGGGDTSARALKCMTMAIYYEAASEADAGQRAVAQVVLNRVAHRSYPNSVCGVVFQGSERRTGCQFSFTCDGSLRRTPSRVFWARAQAVARSALAGAVYRPVGLATHYHTTAIYPYWAPSLHHLGTIGAHRFYAFKGGAGQPGAFRFAYAGYEPSASPRARASIDDSLTTDPLAIAKAYESADAAKPAAGPGTSTPPATGAGAAGRAVANTPPPQYSRAVEERGGDALFRADKLPGSGEVKPEYANSGQWLDRPKSGD